MKARHLVLWSFPERVLTILSRPPTFVHRIRYLDAYKNLRDLAVLLGFMVDSMKSTVAEKDDLLFSNLLSFDPSRRRRGWQFFFTAHVASNTLVSNITPHKIYRYTQYCNKSMGASVSTSLGRTCLRGLDFVFSRKC